MIKKSKGFSFIEVLVTLLVISVGLLAISSFQGKLLKDNTMANQKSEAIIMAQQKIEELRNFEQVLSSAGKTTYEDMAAGTEAITAENTIYTRTWTIAENTALAYKTITLNVSWTAPDGSAEMVTVSSIISKASPVDAGRIIKTDLST